MKGKLTLKQKQVQHLMDTTSLPTSLGQNNNATILNAISQLPSPIDSSSASPMPQTQLPQTGSGLISPIPTAISQLGGSMSSNSPDLVSLVQKYFPKDQWVNALKVIQLESGGNPNAVGDKQIIPNDLSEKLGHAIPSYGLFQIRALLGRPDPSELVNPEFNVQYAANLYKQSGWNPWYNSGKKLGLL